MKQVFAIGLIAASVAGCASYTWYKPNAPADVVQRDERECRELAWKIASDYSFWGPGFDWPSASPRWYPAADPMWRLDAEQRVLDRCMETKGYRLVKQPGQ